MNLQAGLCPEPDDEARMKVPFVYFLCVCVCVCCILLIAAFLEQFAPFSKEAYPSWQQ